MSVSTKNGLMIAGAVVAIVGVLAIAVPAFTTQKTSDVANIGGLKLTATKETSHVVPPFVGPTALVFGVVLIGAGILTKR